MMNCENFSLILCPYKKFSNDDSSLFIEKISLKEKYCTIFSPHHNSFFVGCKQQCLHFIQLVVNNFRHL